MNVNIFAITNFHVFEKIDHFAWIKIHVFHGIPYKCYSKNYFHAILLTNVNYAKICTMRKFLRSQHYISFSIP